MNKKPLLFNVFVFKCLIFNVKCKTKSLKLYFINKVKLKKLFDETWNKKNYKNINYQIKQC